MLLNIKNKQNTNEVTLNETMLMNIKNKQNTKSCIVE